MGKRNSELDAKSGPAERLSARDSRAINGGEDDEARSKMIREQSEKTSARRSAARQAVVAGRSVAVRLNDLDLTRATENAAILMAKVMGRGVISQQPPGGPDAEEGKPDRAIQPGTAGAIAADALFGYLHANAHCRGRLVHGPPRDLDELRYRKNDGEHRRRQSTLEKMWKKLPDPFGYLSRSPDTAWHLDFVVKPGDGLSDVVRGYDGGSISVIAGGPTGSFRSTGGEPNRNNEHYFVLALPLAEQLAKRRNDLRNRLKKALEKVDEPTSIGFAIDQGQVLDKLPQYLGMAKSQITVSTLARDQSSDLSWTLGRKFRQRVFRGSSVAAGITVLSSRSDTHVFFAAVRRPQMLLLATAALATRGTIFAVPVKWSWARADAKYPDVVIEPGTGLLSVSDLVADEDSFLVATGITDSMLLRGVRFLQPCKVTTNSLVLRSKTRSTRFVTHDHYLDRKRFHLIMGHKRTKALIRSIGADFVKLPDIRE